MVIPSLFTGAGALTTQQTAISVIANNIANVNTTGFKGSKIHFAEETSNLISPASSPSAARGGTNPNQVGTGMRISDINTVFSQGSLKNTGVATDLALSGNGFFVVSNAMVDGDSTIQNPQYTRDGHFAVDKSGNLVAADGSRVLAATTYHTIDGRVKDVDGYSNISYFMNQRVGSISSPDYLPNDGIGGNPAVPTPTITNVAGSPVVFNSSNLAELSVRGGLVDGSTSVNTATNGDITVSRREDGRLLFTFDNANAGTAASTFRVSVDTTQQVLDSVTSFEMLNDNGDKIELRIRLEPGVTNLENVFSNIDYDSATTTSDTMVFSGAAATTQSGSRITMADSDLEKITVSQLMSLVSPVKIPNFFFSQDPNSELETSNFTISHNGSISIFGPASDELKLGRLLVSNFTNPDGLVNSGNNRFTESSNSGFAAISVIDGPFNRNAPSLGGTAIVAGALESSNVNLANEFAELIGFQRGLQANSRVISTSDEILQTLINL
jgi:flagellar hook protein FlgE